MNYNKIPYHTASNSLALDRKNQKQTRDLDYHGECHGQMMIERLLIILLVYNFYFILIRLKFDHTRFLFIKISAARDGHA